VDRVDVGKKGINKEEFIEMVNSGMMKTKIARHFSISRYTVMNRIKEWQEEILVQQK